MKTLVFIFSFTFASALFAAVAIVDECNLVQDADSGVATVSFTLSKDAVVTFDVLALHGLQP